MIKVVKESTRSKNVVSIGIGWMMRAMQFARFGHEEMIAMREAMITGNFKGIKFCKDVHTSDWDEELQARIKE